MSQAFVRESDGDLPDDLPELPLSPHPNYVTVRGLAQLQARLDDALARQRGQDPAALDARQQAARLARDIRWLQARIAVAIPVPLRQAPVHAGFGVRVELEDENGTSYRYRIVGEDEAEPEAGLISWTSPLARALDGARIGDEVLWPRPAGDLRVEVMVLRAE